MKNITAFRWLVYLTVLPLMLIEELWRGARTGWDLWRAMTAQHEAKWKKPAGLPQMTPEIAAATAELWNRSADILNGASFLKNRQLPSNQAKTVKFRRHVPSLNPGEAAAVMQLSTANLL